MGLTTTDYIGIGVLITTISSSIVQIINAAKLKSINEKVDGTATQQRDLIEHLHGRLSDKDYQLADAKQIASVLASKAEMEVRTRDIKTLVERRAGDADTLEKLDTIAQNTEATVQAVKEVSIISKDIQDTGAKDSNPKKK